MSKKKWITQRLAAVFFRLLPVMLFLTPASWTLAFPYHPDRQVTIETQFKAAVPHQNGGQETWQIRASRERGKVALNIYPAGMEIPFCTLTLPEEGARGRIVLSEPRQRQERSSDNGLFVLPGHPAPVNILPVEQADTEKFYDEKRTAGGRVFVKRYRVYQETVSLETALQQGWIQKENRLPDTGPGVSDTRPLRMMTVEDDSRTPVVRQLWREGDSWWLYEETPFKRSRRLE